MYTSDEQLRQLYVEQGYGRLKISQIIGRSSSTVQERLDRLGLTDSSRVHARRAPPDDVLTELYTESGFGAARIAKMYGTSSATISKHLGRLGLSDPSRRSLPSGVPSSKRRPSHVEFTAATKQLRFAQESGICQECGQPIPNWQTATYHHIVLVSQGGGREPENCMVIHHECHYDPLIFLKLHGFKHNIFSDKVIAAPEPRQPKVSDDDLLDLLLNQKVPVVQIASRYDLAVPALYRRLYKLRDKGLIPEGTFRKKTLSNEELLQLSASGLSNTAIAKQYDTSVSNISQRLKRLRAKREIPE